MTRSAQRSGAGWSSAESNSPEQALTALRSAVESEIHIETFAEIRRVGRVQSAANRRRFAKADGSEVRPSLRRNSHQRPTQFAPRVDPKTLQDVPAVPARGIGLDLELLSDIAVCES